MRQFVVIAGLVIAMLGGFGAAKAGEITVVGEGVVQRAPDMALVRVGVEREGTTAAEAMAATSAAMLAVFAQVESAGIEARDIQTESVRVGPRWRQADNGRRQVIAGYTASNSLNIRVRDLAALGPLLDAVLSDGANRMDGLSFGLSRQKGAERAARRLAVKDAAARAKTIAKAAGVSVGPVIRIEESFGGGMRPMADMRMAAMEAGGVPIAAGENAVTVTVTATFETLEGVAE